MFWLFKKPEIKRTAQLTNPQSPTPRPKKEIKPWGKKERLWVAIILLITILAGILSLLSNEQKISLPDVSFEVPSKTIELEK